MKRNKLLIILVFGLIFSSVKAQTVEKENSTTILENFKKNCWQQDDYWFGRDKMKHFTTSMLIFVTNYYYQSRYTDYSNKSTVKNSYTISLTFGISKELLDFTGPKSYFSIKDLVVDIAGVATGHIIVNSIR